MENRKAVPAPLLARDRLWPISSLYFLFAIFILASFLSGCASPGEPTERKAPVPAAVADLVAMQSGNDVILTFTAPKETAGHKPLKEVSTIEIYRDFEPATAAGSAASPQAPANPSLVVTIPPGMADHYTEKGHIRYANTLTVEDFTQHPDEVGEYIVRTRTSVKRESADSNIASVRIYPALDPIGDLKSEIAHSVVELAWTAPQKTLAGTAPPISGYRIYRAEVEPGPAASAAADSAPGAQAPEAGGEGIEVKSRLVKVGDTQSTSFEDSQAELGRTYAYSVRSLAQYPGEALESADSNLAIVTVRDIIPPAAPLGLIAVCVQPQDGTPAHAELSWAISPETNIAGYNVYRSEEAGVQGTRINAAPLLSPAFRDMNSIPGQHYFYSVTAVDRSGNESRASIAVSCDEPGESQPAP
jgi:hypothetical protein